MHTLQHFKRVSAQLLLVVLSGPPAARWRTYDAHCEIEGRTGN
jgi:hypothetical protein